VNLLKSKLSNVASLGALAALWCQLAFSQNFTSSITGIITDPSSASVGGAAVELKNMGTNDVRDFTSGDNGGYQFNNLIPGTYQITVTAKGFKTYQRDNVILQANTNTSVNVSLEVGATQQKVEVTESSVAVDTETANNVVTLDSQLIQALPNNTRNPLNFVFAIAGTTPAPSGSGQTTNSSSLDQMSSNFGINGGRTGEAEILIDGAPSQAVDWGGLMVAPLQDSIQEQQIVENTYDAQYERAGAGIVQLITRGGTSQFHGEAYDYLQNDVLDANSWYNNRNLIPKGQFKQNQFGGNIGGPVLKRWNLFFFGGYEGLRQPNTQSILTTVPTQAERNGDFSAALNSDGTPDLIYNPFSTTPASNSAGFTRTQFTNDMIPSNFINPVGQKYVNLLPLPNRAGMGANDINNYANTGPGLTENDKMDTRFDWEQSTKHRMFVRWSDRFRQDIVVPCFYCNGADTGVNQYNNGFQVVLNDTITPSATWVIDTYASYARWEEQHISQGFGVASASTVGLTNSLFQAPVLPTVTLDNQFSNGNSPLLGNGTYERFARTSDTFQVNLTKVFSRHTLKFGGNYDVQQINVISEAAGSFDVTSGFTACEPNTGAACNAVLGSNSSIDSGNAIASLLLGTGSGGGQGISLDPAESLHSYGAYIQDQWRVNPKLTVNAGVRYENQRPATERFNRLTYFDLNVINPLNSEISPLYNEPVSQAIGHPIVGGFEYAGVNGNGRYGWYPDNQNFAPRAGIAYKITDKLVARLGAGIFYLPPSALIGDDGGQSIGFSATTPFVGVDQTGYGPLNLVSNPFPFGINQPTGSSQGLLTLVGSGINGIWPKGSHPTPYTEQWSFDLQYQVNPHSIFEIGYNGNRGKKLLYGNISLDSDQLPDKYLSLGPQLDQYVLNPFYGLVPQSTYYGQNQMIPYNLLLRPYPEFTNLQYTRSLPGAHSAFDALNAKYNYQFNAGLSLLVTYQWSKALDNGPEDYFGWATGATEWRDAYNTNLDYNISTHDIPQSFATAVVYDLPYGRGKHWGNNAPAVVKEVLGNWQLSSVIRLTSGLPLNAVTTGQYNQLDNYGFPGPQLPDLIGNPAAVTNRGPNDWINPNAFADLPSIYMLGNEPLRMTQLRTRALRNVDLSIAKNLAGERFQAWLRGEFLNAFNYAQWNGFCGDLSQTSCFPFGGAQGTENAPRTIQVSLKLTF
jgi:outer membrane receptor protein involved in Fe transport